jgi:outer membrane protein OmpA-like peptidoglycan-associated protein
MKRVLCIFSTLFMFNLTNIFNHHSFAQNLRLNGSVTDIGQKKTIEGVAIYALVDNQRKRIATSDAQGMFSFTYPQAGTALVVEKTGYRTLSIATSKTSAAKEDDPFHIQLPLIALDQQASDRPYMQSEQKDFILDTQDAGKQKVVRLFKIKDALSSQPIHTASICFEYTKVEKKECRDITSSATSQTMVFEEPDIINMVVEAAGYQTYRGNLILEKMDGSNTVYEVRLTPEVTILSLNVKNIKPDLVCTLSTVSGETILMTKEINGSYNSFSKTGLYTLNITNTLGGLLHTEKISVQKGLNYQVVTVTNKVPVYKSKEMQAAKPVTQPAGKAGVVPLADTVKNITLYFEQSTHVLLPEAKKQLDQLALWLHGVPERKIRITGHSDNVGDAKRNETLSEYRARVTYTYLRENGIAAEQMFWVGIGAKRPVEKNDSEENKKKNRRVEITLIPEK